MSNGKTAVIYLQDKLNFEGVTVEQVKELRDRVANEGFFLKGKKGAYGFDKDGNLRLSNYTLSRSREQHELNQKVSAAESCLSETAPLKKLLLERGLIRDDRSFSLEEERPISEWLKEALARPSQFAEALSLPEQRKKLWKLSEALANLDIKITGNDIFAGGESIAIMLKKGTVYAGAVLKEDAVLKITEPKYAKCLDQDSGTRPWETQRIGEIKRIDIEGSTKLYIYLQEKMEVIEDPEKLAFALEQVKQEMEDYYKTHGGKKIFYDHNSAANPQFGIDRNGKIKLLDWTATVDEAYYYAHTKTDDK